MPPSAVATRSSANVEAAAAVPAAPVGGLRSGAGGAGGDCCGDAVEGDGCPWRSRRRRNFRPRPARTPWSPCLLFLAAAVLLLSGSTDPVYSSSASPPLPSSSSSSSLPNSVGAAIFGDWRRRRRSGRNPYPRPSSAEQESLLLPAGAAKAAESAAATEMAAAAATAAATTTSGEVAAWGQRRRWLSRALPLPLPLLSGRKGRRGDNVAGLGQLQQQQQQSEMRRSPQPGGSGQRRQIRPPGKRSEGDADDGDEEEEEAGTRDGAGEDGDTGSPSGAAAISLTGEEGGSSPCGRADLGDRIAEAATAALASTLGDRRRLGRWAATGVQIGLITFLARRMWTAICDVLEEYSDLLDSDGDGGSGGSGSGGAVAPVDVAMAILALEQGEAALSSPDLQYSEPRHRRLVQLARQLAASGMPLRASSDHGKGNSVESMLSRLSKTEVGILQQCLWVPPTTTEAPFLGGNGSDGGSDGNNSGSQLHDVWMQIAGLYSVKDRLLGSLAALSHRGHHQKPHRERGHDFSSLFDSSTSGGGGGRNSSPVLPGILLYGPPGCGKTMLVRALATTSRLPCLVVTPSVLLRKYVGETSSQVRSLFSLARKLSPCILCIDELDGLFRERSDTEHEVSRDLKTEFLQLWDGMLTNGDFDGTTGGGGNILVVGATNRPFDVDSAVLRRLPQSHFVGLPDASTRYHLLQQLLRNAPTDEGVDLRLVAAQTEGYSPSDLKQVLQTAAIMGPMRDQVAVRQQEGDHDDVYSSPRPLTTDDILQALQQSTPTPMSPNYRAALDEFANHNSHRHVVAAAGDATGTVGNFVFGGSVVPDMLDQYQWETKYGNFYNIGNIEVDEEAFETLHNFVQELDNLSDDDDDDDDEDDDESLVDDEF